MPLSSPGSRSRVCTDSFNFDFDARAPNVARPYSSSTGWTRVSNIGRLWARK